MKSSDHTLPASLALTVHVAADEWAFCQRRLTYLEALLLRLVREKKNIQEWYSAGELAALALPGLPPTPEGIIRKASAGRWPCRSASGRKRKRTYHVAGLPARSFDAMVARVLDVPEMSEPRARPVPAVEKPVPLPPNAAPPWVLPLMRLVKAEGDLGAAWRALPNHVPFGMVLPSEEEAAIVLVDLGLMDRLAR